MKPTSKFKQQPTITSVAQLGFSMVELLVGLTLGLLAAAAIFGSISNFELQRQTISSGANMQQNGLLALYAIEQDTRDAGYGLIDSTTKPGKMPCTTINAYLPTLYASAVNNASSVWAVTKDATTGLASKGSSFSSSPVLIADGGGANNSDTITLHRFSSDTGGVVTGGQAAILGANITLVSKNNLPTTGAVNSSAVTVDTGLALHTNDFVLIADSGNCGLLQVVATGASSFVAQEVDNPAGTQTSTAMTNTFQTTTAASIINLGQPASTTTAACPLGTEKPAGTNRINTAINNTRSCSAPIFDSSLYALDGNHDLLLTKDGGIPGIVSSNIVDMQAQYGVSDVGGQAVTCWTNASGTGCNISTGAWSAPVYADVARIKAIRVAIVARSMKKENSNTTTTVNPIAWIKPTTSPPSSNAPVINLNNSVGNNWTFYRYKVYQTIIPLRNVILGTLK